MEMSEPVAWMLTLTDGTHDWILDGNGCEGYIPLYTHTIKELDEQFKKGFEAGKEEGWKAHKFHHPVKDLEDIDINITWNENSMRDFGKDELNFARAILRKAQEPLGEKFEKVLHDNLWEMLEEDGKAQEK